MLLRLEKTAAGLIQVEFFFQGTQALPGRDMYCQARTRKNHLIAPIDHGMVRFLFGGLQKNFFLLVNFYEFSFFFPLAKERKKTMASLLASIALCHWPENIQTKSSGNDKHYVTIPSNLSQPIH